MATFTGITGKLRWASTASVLTLTSLTLSAGTTSAHDDGLENWRFRTGVVCVDTHGWKMWPAREAAARFSASPDLEVVAWSDCSSQPSYQRVEMTTYNDPNDFACAVVDPGKSLDRGGLVRTMTIKFNMAARWFNQCHATAGQRAHLMSHELGHALGLAHRSSGASVMADWRYQWPTGLDLQTVDKRYPW